MLNATQMLEVQAATAARIATAAPLARWTDETIPAPVEIDVPLCELFLEGNYRTPESDKANGDTLLASMRKDRYHATSVLDVVLVKPRKAHGGADLLVTCGNGRVTSLRSVGHDELCTILGFSQDTPDMAIMVRCRVYSGLDSGQIALLRTRDFREASESRPLDAWEGYILVRDLYKEFHDKPEIEVAKDLGWTLTNSAGVVKYNRSLVQDRHYLAMIATVCPEVETEYKALWSGCILKSKSSNREGTKARVSFIKDRAACNALVGLAKEDKTGHSLYSAYMADQVGGDVVRALFQKLLTATPEDKNKDKDKSNGLDESAVEALCGQLSSILAKRVLHAAVGKVFGTNGKPELLTDVAKDLLKIEKILDYTAATYKAGIPSGTFTSAKAAKAAAKAAKAAAKAADVAKAAKVG